MNETTPDKVLSPLVWKYLTSSPLVMPLKHPDNEGIMTLECLRIHCKRCGKQTESLRGSVIYHSPCMEIEAAGVCKDCKLITWTRTRLYPDHLLSWQDSGIKEFPTKTPLWERIASKLFKWI